MGGTALPCVYCSHDEVQPQPESRAQSERQKQTPEHGHCNLKGLTAGKLGSSTPSATDRVQNHGQGQTEQKSVQKKRSLL